jgi:mono/diheme cytochrome c family protein
MRHAVTMRLFFKLLVLGAIVLLAIQLIPYGRDHTNPRTVQELKWNTPATRALAQDGCFACHSNLTSWPWYTSVAPVSWLTQHDVEDGRAKLNFSEWQRPQEADLQDVVEAISGKGMPPLQYRAIHSEARLTDAQRQELEQGITASWVKDPPGR